MMLSTLAQATDAVQAVERGGLFLGNRLAVVLAVLLVIFAGIAVLLLLTNRRISRLEQRQKD